MQVVICGQPLHKIVVFKGEIEAFQNFWPNQHHFALDREKGMHP